MLRNRRASHDYELLETFEAGLELTGSEVKSLRQGGGSIAEAYARVVGSEVFVENMTIPIYQEASYNNHEPTRRRRLLLNAKEIAEISKGLERRGLTLVPLKLYFKGGWAKLEVALARGKKLHDKRDDAARKDAKREIDRQLARSGRK
ncbi:MAG: SsrA-binding protein SmpB [Trueperaceae bacterium]|nr:SsrA-binding protein SmpB [Trueperaceae bacterium]MCO5174463.1 SsrA-binding protein SmpB [Trueperaceae bacterium]MCW5819830.1 SsrA-binding protein SmpB [Trueperaceae bacterium]